MSPEGRDENPGIIFGVFYSVAGYKKKIVAFLITVALGSSVLVVCSARSATEGSETKNSRFEIQNSKSKAGFLFANDPNFSERLTDSASSRELFFKMMLSVLLVAVLGVTAIYVSKKLLPRITNLPGKEIRIIETAHLGPRKAVHLLEIGGRRFLIGSTNENITKLVDITGTLTDLSAQEMDNN